MRLHDAIVSSVDGYGCGWQCNVAAGAISGSGGVAVHPEAIPHRADATHQAVPQARQAAMSPSDKIGATNVRNKRTPLRLISVTTVAPYLCGYFPHQANIVLVSDCSLPLRGSVMSMRDRLLGTHLDTGNGARCSLNNRI